jgi:hypothetical protein
MGLAGDNSPLDGDADPAPLRDQRAASARAQLGESIDALANGLVEIVGTDNERARVVDCVVREAAEFLTRNLSARLAGQNPATAAPAEPASTLERLHSNASGRVVPAKPRRRRKTAPAAQPQAAPAAAPQDPPQPPATAPEAKPKRKRAPRKPKAAPVVIPPPLTEEEKLAAESDRLDYLTPEEGRQLTEGKAPSKRLRRATPANPAA